MAISEKRFIRLAALLLSLLLPLSAYAGSLFPSADSLFGVVMPDMRFAVGREPDSVQTAEGGEEHTYYGFTAEEYDLFSRYLAAENVTLKSYGTEEGVFTAELELNGAAFTFRCVFSEREARVLYPKGTRPERTASEAALPEEGVLPSVRGAFGAEIPMPSLGDVLGRYPEEVSQLPDGGEEQRWSGLTDADFEAFGAYLAARGASLGDHAVTASGFSAAVELEGSAFSFAYDPAAGTATVTYPAGVYDERLREAEERYAEASALMALGRYGEALTAFMSIRDHEGYRDVGSLLANDQNLAAAAAARDAKYSVGNYVTFGHYPQTGEGNDSTPIEWLVVARDGNKALLLSRYGLDAKPYNEKYVDITWEKCTLRTWLNGTFLNKAFTAEEQKGILLTNVDNGSSQGYSKWSTSGGNNTQDRVFLLSYAEANRYLGVAYEDIENTKSRVAPTAYALKQGAYTSSSNKTADSTAAGWWWLRSPGSLQYYAAYVNCAGFLGIDRVYDASGCVRPALWINLESDIF